MIPLSYSLHFLSSFPFQYLSSFISFLNLNLTILLYQLSLHSFLKYAGIPSSFIHPYHVLHFAFFFPYFLLPHFPISFFQLFEPSSISSFASFLTPASCPRNIVPFLSPNLLTFSHSLHPLSLPNITAPKNYPLLSSISPRI